LKTWLERIENQFCSYEDAVAGRAKTLSYKAFTGFATNDQPPKGKMISQRMASGQTHVNTFIALGRKS
jgi:hypothetical protein